MKGCNMKCRVCDSENLEMVLDLGMQPWGNNFLYKEQVGKEPYYPLRVMFCKDCHTAQLDYTVKKEIMFGNHTYLSGITKSLSDHFKTVAEELDKQFFSKQSEKSVLDIGLIKEVLAEIYLAILCQRKIVHIKSCYLEHLTCTFTVTSGNQWCMYIHEISLLEEFMNCIST